MVTSSFAMDSMEEKHTQPPAAKTSAPIIGEHGMISYPPATPHGKIQEVFSDIFVVMGTNRVQHEGVDTQFSRNMVIIRNQDEIALINTVRLDEEGLLALNKLGNVKHVVRIGAFHGKDDAFYVDHYGAKLWSLKGAQNEHGKLADEVLTSNGPMFFPGISLFLFETAVVPEAILYLEREGGIIITCDSIQNWTEVDQYFDAETAKSFAANGLIKTANISPIWGQATQVKVSDFERLMKHSFRHLLSAHGEPLLNDAYQKIEASLNDYRRLPVGSSSV